MDNDKILKALCSALRAKFVLGSERCYPLRGHVFVSWSTGDSDLMTVEETLEVLGVV